MFKALKVGSLIGLGVVVGAFALAGPAGAFVYVANQGSANVSQYADTLGPLSPLSPASVADTAGAPSGVAVSPNGKWVYVTNSSTGQVSQYLAGPNGKLRPMSTPTIAAGAGASAITDTFATVAVANFNAGTLSEFAPRASGELRNPFTTTTGVEPAGVAESPRTVYVTSEAGNDVWEYRRGAGGSAGTVAAGSGPVGIAFDELGSFVYVVNEQGATISEYRNGQSALRPLSPPTVRAPGGDPMEIAVDPKHHGVYVTNDSGGTVSQYHVGAGGELSPMRPATVPAGSHPYGVAVSPNGKWVYVTDSSSGEVSQYDVEAGGVLHAMSPATVTAGVNPAGLAVDSGFPWKLKLSAAPKSATIGTPLTIKAVTNHVLTGTAFFINIYVDGKFAKKCKTKVCDAFVTPGPGPTTYSIQADVGKAHTKPFNKKAVISSRRKVSADRTLPHCPGGNQCM